MMKLPLHNISIDKRIGLIELIKNARKNGTFLSAHIQNAPIPNFWLLGSFLIFILFVVFVNSWSLFYWLLFSGPFLSYFIFRQLECFWYWKKLGKDSVFFDNQFFISIQNKTIYFVPLSEFKYSDIVLSGNEQHYLIRFHFNSISLLQPCKKNSATVLQFQNLLQNYTVALKQMDIRINYIPNIKHSFADKLLFKKNAILFSFIIGVILWFALPSIIDSNAFNYAKGINTATSFRDYLAQTKNVRFRDEARSQINRIYNQYIAKYRNSLYYSSVGAEAFITILEYLRDKNLYNVSLHFISVSQLKDIYENNHQYNIIPIAGSFTKNKNASRENEVYNTIKSTLGSIFPSDIFNLTRTDNNLIPKFEVYYIYKNKNESLYYRAAEEDLPDNKKTWYYGIEIEWRFRIFLPTHESAIYEFSLKSEPANQFSSETFNPDEVYTNMAISAFNDFKDEFYKQFLKY